MKHLIVTADDFGVFPSINAGVTEAIINKKVNSVACLSNFEHSVSNIKKLISSTNDQADIGCHLTITSGKPIHIKDNDAFMYGHYFKPYSEIDIKGIEVQLPVLKKELIAQVEILKDSGIHVKHLSCHHNSLTLTPKLLTVYMEVANSFKLPMRSVNIIPVRKKSQYQTVLNLMLCDDMSLKKLKELTRFSKVIINFFNSHALKIKTPALLESSHYGPIPVVEVLDINLASRIRKKHKNLHEFLSDFSGRNNSHAELMLHLIKKDLCLLEEDDCIDYPGINLNYFDSRHLEFVSINQFDFNAYPQITISSWETIL